MRRWIIVVLGLMLVACGTPPAQIPPSDVHSEADATPQDAIGDLTAVAAGDAPMDATNEPLHNPQGPTATNTVPATLIATAIEQVEYVGLLRFVDETHGWMWADKTVFATVDGGQQWRGQFSTPFNTQIQHADFISARYGWIAVTNISSATSSLFATEDGGATWHELLVDPQFGAAYWIDFVDAQYGWMVAHTTEPTLAVQVLHTTDGGKTWTQIVNPCPPSTHRVTHSLSFIDREQGWIACAAWQTPTQVYHTTDSGQRWQAVPLPPPAQPGGSYALISFQDPLHGPNPTLRLLAKSLYKLFVHLLVRALLVLA